ncbi:DNA polymerase beta superfamily protein [Roseospira visakhapatnamensis]|uniref:Nucleotidyltransferase n=1 Tax=Roseospira visakhapatnamensis TaxID=390880 RepID=A0A7W6W938_9PROT|nr:nucleotidyltransferase domain-containing protein [Roseospira visakhapatnamensis]MBB4265685.1 hypothetical protein [Roseospira visakhapatnamensis]
MIGALTGHLETQGARLLFACQVGEAVEGTVPAHLAAAPPGVRFLYVRPADWYLTIAERPDALDGPGADSWGWDLRKACRLLLRSNPLLWSWLASPSVLADPEGLGAALRTLAGEGTSRRTLGHALWDEARKALTAYLERGESPTAVKSVKAARALLALRWLDTGTLPPVALEDLMDGLGDALDPAVRADVDAILSGTARTHPALYRWINAELDSAAERCAALPEGAPDPAAADALYRRVVLRNNNGAVPAPAPMALTEGEPTP